MSASPSRRTFQSLPLAACLLSLAGAVHADQTISDDLIVYGDACVGTNCTLNMDFGANTLVLKYDVVRLLFDDTSTTSGYPANDWQLTINDSYTGGANRFTITDVTGNKVPFTIEAGMRSYGLYLDSGGHIGLGTNNPVRDIHIKTGDTPGIRLQQDTSNGFASRTWDIAGNAANFFIEDATYGGTAIRIYPNPPDNAIVIEGTTGNIGLGTSDPDGPLHINRDNAWITLGDRNNNDKWFITHTAPDNGNLEFASELDGSGIYTRALILKPNGNVGLGTATPDGPLHISQDSAWITLEDKNDNDKWFLTHQAPNNGELQFTSQLDGGAYNVAFRLSPSGNLVLAGALTQGSDRNAKVAVEALDTAEILRKVTDLPLSAWSYGGDDSGARHVGPMAQDFHALFGLGESDTGISTLDTSGVALAAIQALAERNTALSAQVSELAAQNAALARRLDLLETAGN